MHYVICYPCLAPEERDRIEAFRRRHDPVGSAMVAAHVTLVFGVVRVAVDDLLGRARRVAARVGPFDIVFDSIGSEFAPARSWLYLTVGRGADALGRIHRDLYAGPAAAERRVDPPFVPHLTIASSAETASIEAARRASDDLVLPIGGRIEALQIATLHGTRLEPVARVPLAGTGDVTAYGPGTGLPDEADG